MTEFQRVQIDLRVLLELDEYFIDENSVGLPETIDWWVPRRPVLIGGIVPVGRNECSSSSP